MSKIQLSFSITVYIARNMNLNMYINKDLTWGFVDYHVLIIQNNI